MPLPLELRQEFLSRFMRGTAIELRNRQNTGWVQREPTELLRITYPTADVQGSLRAVSKSTGGKPVVLLGQRGRGKSHILALLHHALQSSAVVEDWAKVWAVKLGSPSLADLSLQRGFLPISETLSNQEYPHLWDLIFERHPRGQYYRGKFEQAGTTVPAKSLLQDLFAEQHTALILDEFQPWFDGLHDEAGDSGPKRRQWSFNFIQILSELAKERPDLLFLIVSVRDTATDAFRQIHRDAPALVDFKGEATKSDRKRLVLHRLFENRDNFAAEDVGRVVAAYAGERVRLLYADKTDDEKAIRRREVVESWPFSPELLGLLEDHILMAEVAQETRDLIRILAEVFRSRGGRVPLLTPADFAIDDDHGGVTSLIDSLSAAADLQKLREVAQRNLRAIRESGAAAPHAGEVLNGIWFRSLSVTQVRGATRAEVQLDLTREAPIDDNAFSAELKEIFENSGNIHEAGTGETRYCFRIPENTLTKLKASARNDKLFESEAVAFPGLLPIRRDQKFLRDVLNHHLRSPDSASEPPSRVIVLDLNWERSPWANLPQEDLPEKWDRPVLLVLPAAARGGESLGPWLAANVGVNRNLVRFLLPRAGLPNLYDDPALLITARCTLLAKEWKESDSQYTEHFKRFDRELRKELADRFDRFAVLSRWDFPNPGACVFHVEPHGAAGAQIPAAVEKKIKEDFFAPEDFEAFLLACAARGDSMKQVLALLREPPVRHETEAIPYLGEPAILEQVIRIAAMDKVALNGTWYRPEPGQTAGEALPYLRQRVFKTGKELHSIQLGDPRQVGGGGVAVVSVPTTASGGATVTAIPAAIAATHVGAAQGHAAGAVGPGGTPAAPAFTHGTGDATAATPAVPTAGANGGVAPASPQPIIRRSLGAKTGINLLGELERWALPDAQKTTQATLTFSGLSIKELRELCIKLPPKVQAELQITLPPEAEGGLPE